MASPSKVPYQFDPGTKILSDQVDANFQFCLDYIYDIAPLAVQTFEYLTYGIKLEYDESNYKIQLALSTNLLYFSSITFTRNSTSVAASSTGPVVFAPNIPSITDLGLYIDFGSTNLVERYQDYPIFATKQSAAGSTQFLVDKGAELLTAGFAYFPSKQVFCIDNTPNAGGSYTINLECAATVIGQTYELNAIVWADTGTVRLGLTNSTFTELASTSATPVKLTDTFVATAVNHQLYLKASASSKVYGIGLYLGPVTNQKVPTYARNDNSYLGNDINNIYTGPIVDPVGITGLTNSAGTATLALTTDTATQLLKDIIKPGKLTNNVIRIDNSAGAVVGKIILDQAALTVGVPYTFTVYARIVSGTGGKIRNDNAGPLADIPLSNGNYWSRYTGTFTPTVNNQRLFIEPAIGAVVDIAACYITQAAALSQSLVPYHLGTTTTYDDNLVWIPNLTPSPVVAEWGNQYQTEVDISQGVPLQLGIDGEAPWIKQNFMRLRSLEPGETIRTYTTPDDVTLLKTLWNYDYSGRAIDPTEFTVLDFIDDFTVLSVGEQTATPTPIIKWFSPVHSKFGYYKCSFVSPAQSTALGLQTYTTDGTELRMRLEQQGLNVYGGCMTSVNLAGQGYRCPDYFRFEIRCKFPPHDPNPKFPWSAVWFKNPAVVESTADTYIEFDLAEIYTSDNTYWHTTWHIWPGAHPQTGGVTTHQFKSNLFPVNLVDGAYHTLTMDVTPYWIITYVDGFEARRIPYYAEFRLNNPYILLNLTGIDDAAEYNAFVSPADWFIDYVKVWKKA